MMGNQTTSLEHDDSRGLRRQLEVPMQIKAGREARAYDD